MVLMVMVMVSAILQCLLSSDILVFRAVSCDREHIPPLSSLARLVRSGHIEPLGLRETPTLVTSVKHFQFLLLPITGVVSLVYIENR